MRTASLRFVVSLGSLIYPHRTRTLSLNLRFSFYTQVRFPHCASTRELPPSKIVVEYAKSGRSACKKCANAINKDAVRVGTVIKDPRGFDAPKWHHMHCFPYCSSESTMSSAEAISGFSSLKVHSVFFTHEVFNFLLHKFQQIPVVFGVQELCNFSYELSYIPWIHLLWVGSLLH